MLSAPSDRLTRAKWLTVHAQGGPWKQQRSPSGKRLTRSAMQLARHAGVM